jgi:alanyl-tRNA synthetase
MADKSLNEIRNTFLKYFEKNDHKIVESSNLVPNNDPTFNVCKLRDGTI